MVQTSEKGMLEGLMHSFANISVCSVKNNEKEFDILSFLLLFAYIADIDKVIRPMCLIFANLKCNINSTEYWFYKISFHNQN